MLKKWLGFLGAFLFSSVVFAQTTVVVGVATDSDSVVWANGTISAQFVPNPIHPNLSMYRINGAPLDPAVVMQGPISLDSNGSFSVTVYDNTQVTPGGSQWQFTVCPNAISKCGSVTTSVTGIGQSITTAIDAAIPAPRFNAIAGAYGYANVEAILTYPVGGTYWSVTNQTQMYWNGTTWVTGSLPSGISCVGTGSSQVCTFPGAIVAGAVNGTLYVGSTAYATIQAAVTAAAALTPVPQVIVPASYTGTDSSNNVTSSVPVTIQDQRNGETYTTGPGTPWGPFNTGSFRQQNMEILRNTKVQLAYSKLSGCLANHTTIITGDSTGGMVPVQLMTYLQGKMCGNISGVWNFIGGSAVAVGAYGQVTNFGSVAGNNLYSSFLGSGNYANVADPTYAHTPTGRYLSLNDATGTISFNVYKNVSEKLTFDTAYIYYIAQPGGGTVTVAGIDGAGNSTPLGTINTSGTAALQVATFTGVFSGVSITGGSAVSFIAGAGAYCSTCAGLNIIDLSSSGMTSQGWGGLTPSTDIATLLASFPPVDLLTQTWKNNGGLTAAQAATNMLAEYNYVAPHADHYNITNAPNALDFLVIGTETNATNNGAYSPYQDQNTAMRTDLDSIPNSVYVDDYFAQLGTPDATARYLYGSANSTVSAVSNVGNLWTFTGANSFYAREPVNGFVFPSDGNANPLNNSICQVLSAGLTSTSFSCYLNISPTHAIAGGQFSDVNIIGGPGGIHPSAGYRSFEASMLFKQLGLDHDTDVQGVQAILAGRSTNGAGGYGFLEGGTQGYSWNSTTQMPNFQGPHTFIGTGVSLMPDTTIQAPIVIPTATGSTTYTYSICAGAKYATACSPSTTITNGPASIATTPNIIHFTRGNERIIFIYRTVGGTTQGGLTLPTYGTTNSDVYYDANTAASGSEPPANSQGNSLGINIAANQYFPLIVTQPGWANGLVFDAYASNNTYQGMGMCPVPITNSCNGPSWNFTGNSWFLQNVTSRWTQNSSNVIEEEWAAGSGMNWGTASLTATIPSSSVVVRDDVTMPGITLGQSSAPSFGSGSLSTATTGGTCPASTTYYYKEYATTPFGTTTQSAEGTITTGSTTGTNKITINGYPTVGATSYAYSRGTTSGSELILATGLMPISMNGTVQFVDTCAVTPSGTPPSVNTSGGHLLQSSTGNLGGTCTMATATSCTLTLNQAFTSKPICLVTEEGSTPIAGSCAATAGSTTVTVNASTSNSATWDVLLIGNPN